MGRKTPAEATSILIQQCSELGEPSSSKPTRAPINKALNRKHYWSGVSDNMASTERSKAYLRAYQEIAGDAPIYATGILLTRGRMPLDKSVMWRLMRDGFVEFKELPLHSQFEITPDGQSWMNQ
jgi:hypothetical protein